MKILLATLHAKYAHSSLALPCLAAACAGLTGVSTQIREFTVNEQLDGILRMIAAEGADVVAFSCYIWNIGETLKIASDLKKIAPDTYIVLGGPEASHGVFELMEKNPAVDCVVRGEGEATFSELVAALTCRKNHADDYPQMPEIEGTTIRSHGEIIAAHERQPIANLDDIPSPFAAGLVDLNKPLVYYETSRGCPFSCAFCMSSLEKGVRSFGMDRIRSDLTLLMERRVGTVKLVDRTFNFDARRANEIWHFILERNLGSVFHFEIAADLLTQDNIGLLAQVPPGMFRFEIGVQSGAEATLDRVGRKSDLDRLFANVSRLLAETGVTIHLDLVAGLPNEDFAGFLDSLQRLLDARPHHIQVEPLKVLKGSPMRRIAREEKYAHADAPPYKILRTPWLTFAEIGRIETISRLLELYYNSGKFKATLGVIVGTMVLSRFLDGMSAWWEKKGLPPHLSQTQLFSLIWEYGEQALDATSTAQLHDALCFDLCSAEYPSAGNSPAFFPSAERQADGPGKAELAAIARRLEIPDGARVRSYARTFNWDFRAFPYRKGTTALIFVYISSPGLGLRVKVLPLSSKDSSPEPGIFAPVISSQ